MSIYVPGKVVLAQQQKIPAVLGEPWGGGYFVGYISHTQDGNPTHALIVAPKATGQNADLAYKTTNTNTTGADSTFDGAANTAAMVADGIANHPAAEFCVNLSIGGYTDWYLPATLELDIAYFNLKPGTDTNNTAGGSNTYAVPRRDNNFSPTYPAQTSLALFNSGAEAFDLGQHKGSTSSGVDNINVTFVNGARAVVQKISIIRTRAFRRIAL